MKIRIKFYSIGIYSVLISFLLFSCNNPDDKTKKSEQAHLKIRQQVDTIGFTQYPWQLDSIFARMDVGDKISTESVYKMAICPHDDYAYAGGLYAKTLNGIKAKTIILIGVAHKAQKFNLENKLVFGSFDVWSGTYGDITISPLRDKLLKKMAKESYIVHDSMMQVEHSLEAITPFLQRNNKALEIVPFLVPHSQFHKMEVFAQELATALAELMKEENLDYGKDIAIVISTDAIHYGDVDWSSDKMAPFGVDDKGTARVIEKEHAIIDQCLVGDVSTEKARLFSETMLEADDFRVYKWYWCGRYDVPFGMMFANDLNALIHHKPLSGNLIDYRSSLHNKPIETKDIGMGVTADAHQRHWVGYVGVVYK
ncbi:MAG: AmmeMemoRadiSam system protein B [Bacteroidales bacterium]|nr:AmmeMemoRadiSam system protein B [Bacteroidales bacterium]